MLAKTSLSVLMKILPITFKTINFKPAFKGDVQNFLYKSLQEM